MAKFPTNNWLIALMEKLNNDTQYESIAKKWEGDMIFKIEADSSLNESIIYYLDLWHGKCRNVDILAENEKTNAAVIMSSPYRNVAKVIKGETEVFQALLTRKISVKGDMALIMRNIPTVLDFVRCCREITTEFV